MKLNRKFGWILVITSVLLFAGAAFLSTRTGGSPFLIGLAVACAILSEVCFWAGGSIVGFQWVKRWKARKKDMRGGDDD